MVSSPEILKYRDTTSPSMYARPSFLSVVTKSASMSYDRISSERVLSVSICPVYLPCSSIAYYCTYNTSVHVHMNELTAVHYTYVRIAQMSPLLSALAIVSNVSIKG